MQPRTPPQPHPPGEDGSFCDVTTHTNTGPELLKFQMGNTRHADEDARALALSRHAGRKTRKHWPLRLPRKAEVALKHLLTDWCLDKSQLGSKPSNPPSGRDFSDYVTRRLPPVQDHICDGEATPSPCGRSFGGERAPLPPRPSCCWAALMVRKRFSAPNHQPASLCSFHITASVLSSGTITSTPKNDGIFTEKD